MRHSSLAYPGLALSMALAMAPGPISATVLETVTNPANAHIYHLLDAASWADSEAESIALGGHLATVSNRDENEWIRLQWSSRSALWIGMNDLADEGTFSWSSGQPILYTNYGSGEPDGGPGANYVRLIVSGGWWEDTTVDGGDKTFGVVEVDAPRVLDRAAYPGDERTYYLLSASDWSNAQSKAQQMGGHLVTVNSGAEADWIRSTWPTYERIWLGLTDVESEGLFVWVSGQPVTHTAWAAGEPDGGASRNFVCTEEPHGQWTDQPLYGDAPTFGLVEVVGVLADIRHATEITWISEPGASYQVQFSDDPASHAWSNLHDVVHGDGGTSRVFDSTWALPHRVYRVVTLE